MALVIIACVVTGIAISRPVIATLRALGFAI